VQFKNRKIINEVKAFIIENYDQELPLKKIAGAMFLSPGYLTRIFKQEIGITVMGYLKKVKLEEAKKLLRNPRYKIDDIASKIGYKDSSYFAKVFQRYEKHTPSEYRKQII
jgi:AraC-like DNA-binding protein